MDNSNIENAYFDWMCRHVCYGKSAEEYGYFKLLSHLHMIDFTYLIDMDGNRATDGIDIRYRFGNENNIPQPVISSVLDVRPCSVLEMMVALSIRCEEHIMDNPDIGDRTSEWFWGMICTLDLQCMNDHLYDRERVAEVIDILLNRKYDCDGHGGLFIVRNGPDMRITEIWYQLMWYLRSIGG